MNIWLTRLVRSSNLSSSHNLFVWAGGRDHASLELHSSSIARIISGSLSGDLREIKDSSKWSIKIWMKYTHGGASQTKYKDIDYYAIFPDGTVMKRSTEAGYDPDTGTWARDSVDVD